MPAGAGRGGTFGRLRDSGFGIRGSGCSWDSSNPESRVPNPGLTAGLTSYARRLMLSRCLGEMLSDVMLPPQPPQPSVIAGSSPVVNPIDPCVVGVLTQMRNAGFFNPNCRMISSFFESMDMV